MSEVERHTIACIVDNESGVLARVVGLFSGRGYNIESLTVAVVDSERELSRITLLTSGTRMIVEQIKAQLGRLVPVREVIDLTDDGPHVERELALLKVSTLTANTLISKSSSSCLWSLQMANCLLQYTHQWPR